MGSAYYPHMQLLTFLNNISVHSPRISKNWSVFQQSSADRHMLNSSRPCRLLHLTFKLLFGSTEYESPVSLAFNGFCLTSSMSRQKFINSMTRVLSDTNTCKNMLFCSTLCLRLNLSSQPFKALKLLYISVLFYYPSNAKDLH